MVGVVDDGVRGRCVEDNISGIRTHDTSLVNLLSSGIFILIHQVLTSAPSPIQSDIPCSNSPP